MTLPPPQQDALRLILRWAGMWRELSGYQLKNLEESMREFEATRDVLLPLLDPKDGP